ncbi:MAG: hypothetical protein ACE37H_03665 [Phycisphaeraceae bacterium]
MQKTKAIPSKATRRLIDELIPQLHSAAGTKFTRRTLWRILIPLYRLHGRSDCNYGSWVSTRTAPGRPLKLISNGVSREDDILRIRKKWLKRHNLDPSRIIGEEHAAANAFALYETSGAETFDQYIARKLGDPRE